MELSRSFPTYTYFNPKNPCKQKNNVYGAISTNIYRSVMTVNTSRGHKQHSFYTPVL